MSTGNPTIEECLEVLGLKPDASIDDCKRAHRDLVEVWHPDRFAHNERLQRQATEKLQAINAATSWLDAHWSEARSLEKRLPSPPRPHILCVDDDPLALRGLRRQLSTRYEVIEATNAADGLAILLGDQEIAVIISDLKMPEVDGIAFLRQAMSASPNTTRILLTGFRDRLDLAVALDRLLLFEILEKPCDGDRLFDAVERGVERALAHVDRGRASQP